jgi:translation initiation factor IF-3
MALRRPRCIFNTATALHRVFISPIEQSTPRFAHRTAAPLALSLSLSLSRQTRCYASSPAPSERRLPRDDMIKSWSVILVNDDGTLGETRTTYDVMQSLDRGVDMLVQVAPSEPGQLPVCKIVNKRVAREAEKARAKSAKSSGVVSKTLELNWAIDRGDLGHRLDRLKQFLAKGYKVEIVLAGKRKGKQATQDEAWALIKRVLDVVGEVDGAREAKPMEGKVLGTATLYLAGTPE